MAICLQCGLCLRLSMHPFEIEIRWEEHRCGYAFGPNNLAFSFRVVTFADSQFRLRPTHERLILPSFLPIEGPGSHAVAEDYK
jgi:hypothetical protein